MAEQSMLDAFALIRDEKVRAVLEYLIQNLTASSLRISYALKMGPEDVEGVLRNLEASGLIHKAPSQMPGDVYVLTEKGQQMKRYMRGPSTSQYKM